MTVAGVSLPCYSLIQVISLSRLSNYIFFTIISIYLYGDYFDVFHLTLLKPIPILILILKAFFIKKALVFSIVGDILLMFQTDVFFKIGTLSFLIAHLCFIHAFYNDYKSEKIITKENHTKIHIGCFFIIMLYIGNLITLWNVLPDKILFSVYGLVLVVMSISSFYRLDKAHTYGYKQVIIGAILFMVSDNLIAIFKFNRIQTSIGDFAIMVLYYGGQFLILKGMGVKNFNFNK